MTAAQKANGTSYNDLYRIWVASEAKLKSLEGTLKRNADGTFKLTEEYKKAKIESSNAKKALDEFGKGINNNKLNVGNYTESIKEALKQTGLFGRLNISGGMIALGAAVAGIWNQFKSAIQYTKEFEKSLSSLRALTGASSDDLKFYRQAAKDLGNQFGTTGAEMVEAFKIVGSAKSELLKSKEELVNVTEAAVLLSKAAGMDVPSAANSLTIAMNQFSAPAEEAGRYINVLAAGAKEGAAEIPDLSDSLTKFGAVAASSNVSIEQSVALIEALSARGTVPSINFVSFLVETNTKTLSFVAWLFVAVPAKFTIIDAVSASETTNGVGNRDPSAMTNFPGFVTQVFSTLSQSKKPLELFTLIKRFIHDIRPAYSLKPNCKIGRHSLANPRSATKRARFACCKDERGFVITAIFAFKMFNPFHCEKVALPTEPLARPIRVLATIAMVNTDLRLRPL